MSADRRETTPLFLPTLEWAEQQINKIDIARSKKILTPKSHLTIDPSEKFFCTELFLTKATTGITFPRVSHINAQLPFFDQPRDETHFLTAFASLPQDIPSDLRTLNYSWRFNPRRGVWKRRAQFQNLSRYSPSIFSLPGVEIMRINPYAYLYDCFESIGKTLYFPRPYGAISR